MERHIEITFRHADGRYEFVPADRKIWIAHRDREKATSWFIRLVGELIRKGISCRVEAYAPLGAALSQIRNTGAICESACETLRH
jgi:hypothetical protein